MLLKNVGSFIYSNVNSKAYVLWDSNIICFINCRGRTRPQAEMRKGSWHPSVFYIHYCKDKKYNVLQYSMFPNILKNYFKSSLLPASIFNQTVNDLKVFWRKTNSLKCWRVSLSLLTVIFVPAALNSRSLLAWVAGIANSFAATLATQGYFFRLASTNQRD